MSSFEALIVDFGGVLTTPLQDAMMAFAEEQGIEFSDLLRLALAAYAGETDELVVGLETGKISEEDFVREFAGRLSAATGVAVAPDDLLQRIFRGLELEQPMFDAVAEARRLGLKTGLCSNSWGLGLYPMDELKELFDVVVISGEVGLRKPDAEIFNLTIKRLGVRAEASIFVDDHPGHLKAAAELGMATVLHRTPAQTIAELETILGSPLSGH